ncbi:MAG: VWA domain-containing protein, partial [Planctomycetota bacterium]
APTDLLELESFDLVLLRDVPSEALPTAAAPALAAYVRDLGGGLAMIGGANSFGAGGWKGSPLEPVLPVSLDLPERLVSPEAAIVFVLDNSGSMGWAVMGSSRTKQQIVNDATALAVRTMDRRDLVGVIAFNQSPRVIVPLGTNEDPDRSIARIRSISPGGGTDIGPALEEARRQLRSSDAKVKHVILLSDGQSMAPEVLPAMAARMQREGIRVSTIAVGQEADLPTMRSIADNGEGTFYEVMNPNRLPRVFVKAVRVVRTPLIREQRFSPVMLRPDDALALPLGSSPPPLEGLVLTTAREELGVRDVLATPEGEPVLSVWRVGLGQVAAFTSDASVWAEPWIEPGVFDRFWTNLARTLARPGSTSPADLRLSVDGNRLRLQVEMTDENGAPRDGLSVTATVYGPDGGGREVTLTPSAPGVYEGESLTDGSGVHVAVVKPRDDGRALAPALAGVSVSSQSELRRLESDEALLSRLAEAGGGRVLDLDALDPAELFDRSELPPRTAETPLWPVLLAWTLVVALLDFATRRVAWDRWLSPNFGGDWREEARRSVADRSRAAATAVGGLRGALRRSADDQADATAIAFDQRDAEAASRAQVERIRAERLAEVREQAKRSRKASGATEIDPAPIVDATEPSDDEGALGLLAAKRRARERYEPEDES